MATVDEHLHRAHLRALAASDQARAHLEDLTAQLPPTHLAHVAALARAVAQATDARADVRLIADLQRLGELLFGPEPPARPVPVLAAAPAARVVGTAPGRCCYKTRTGRVCGRAAPHLAPALGGYVCTRHQAAAVESAS